MFTIKIRSLVAWNYLASCGCVRTGNGTDLFKPRSSPGFIDAKFSSFQVSDPEMKLCSQKPDSHQRVHRIGVVDPQQL
jgi:hypothetical protein